MPPPLLATPPAGPAGGGDHAHSLTDWAGPKLWTRHFHRKLSHPASGRSWSCKSGHCVSMRGRATNSYSEIRSGPLVSGLDAGPAAGEAAADEKRLFSLPERRQRARAVSGGAEAVSAPDPASGAATSPLEQPGRAPPRFLSAGVRVAESSRPGLRLGGRGASMRHGVVRAEDGRGAAGPGRTPRAGRISSRGGDAPCQPRSAPLVARGHGSGWCRCRGSWLRGWPFAQALGTLSARDGA